MGKEEFLKELHSFSGVLRAGGVVPEEIIEHYASWGTVQHGEAGESLEGTVLFVTEGWFHIYSVTRVGATEEAVQRAIPLSALKQITRTWRGSRGFDDSEGTETADEYSAVLRFEGEEKIELPVRDDDYIHPSSAWSRAQALTDALIRAAN